MPKGKLVVGREVKVSKVHIDALLVELLLHIFNNFLLQMFLALMVRTVVVFIEFLTKVKAKYIEFFVKPCELDPFSLFC